MESSNGLSNLKASNETFFPFTPFSFHHDSKLFCNPSAVGSQSSRKAPEGVNHHQRCSSESFIEQPSWLDDLLDDSETIFYKGHRRSASDSYTYLGESATSLFTGDESEFVNAYFGTSTRSQEPGHYKDFNSTSVETKGSSLAQKNKQETEEGTSFLAVENSRKQSTAQNLEGSPDKAGGSQAKNAGSKTDSKRSKQHNAHRSRVRKLQYIAHLERTLEMLKAEECEISAELEFVEQQNIILTMENKALRQRLESLSQEQLIKHWEQGMLEREIGRLQSLYHLQKEQQMHMHHQQQQQQQLQTHNQYSKQRRNRSRDLDHQANNTSLKNKEASSTKGSANGSIHI